MNENAVAIYQPGEIGNYMPAATVELAMERREIIKNFVAKVMRPGLQYDYGIIPGTPKPTLLKPGAEKLCNLFGLSPSFQCLKEDEDWDGRDHGGEPFFNYKYSCRLTRNAIVVGEGEGSCNSHESKYRYRDQVRKCPKCGKEAIAKGKEEFGGGWYCNKRRDGCGEKFEAGDPAIEDQQIGRVLNPDIADSVNTIQKIAQKRALIAATLIACSASEFFTQDLEDEERGKGERKPTIAPKRKSESRAEPMGEAKTIPAEVEAIWRRITDIATTVTEFQAVKDRLVQAIGSAGEAEYKRVLEAAGVQHSNEFKGRLELARQTIRTLWLVTCDAEALRGKEA